MLCNDNSFLSKKFVANGIGNGIQIRKVQGFSIHVPMREGNKNFGAILDTYMADGLNISIGAIISEVGYNIQMHGTNEAIYDISALNNCAYINDKTPNGSLDSFQS